MKKILLLIAGMLILQFAYTQNNDYMWTALVGNATDYDSICTVYENYLQTTYPDSIPKATMGAIKRYHRYNYFWNSRLGQDSGQTSYMPYTRAAIDNMLSPICEGTDDADWQLMGPSSYPEQWLGLVDEVLYDPLDSNRIIISCDRGGIWVREDSAGSWVWRNVTDNLRLPGLCASEIIRNPFEHGHLMASTASGILNSGDYGIGIIESFDNGETWAIQDSFPYQTAPYIRRIIIDPNDTVSADGINLFAIANGNETIYKSENSGASWSVFNGPPHDSLSGTEIIDIEIDDLGAIYISTQSKWIATGGRIYKYSSGQWIDLNASKVFGEFKRIRMSMPDSGKIFVLCDGFLGGVEKRRIYKTNNYGSTWTIIKEIDPNWLAKDGPCPQSEIEYSPASNIIYLGEIYMRVFKDEPPYTDHRETPLHDDIRDFSFIGIKGEYEKVLIATDGGLTLGKVKLSDITDIEQMNLNGSHLPIGDFIGIGVGNSSGDKVIGGTVHCGTWVLEDNTWNLKSNPLDLGDGGDCEVNWSDPSIYYYQMNQNMKSYNPNTGSNTIYNYINDWFIGMKYELHPENPYQVFFGRAKKMVVHGTDTSYISHLMKYDERNDILTEIEVSDTLSKVGPIAIANNSLFYVADFSLGDPTTNHRMMKTTNGGTQWDDLSLNTVYHKVGGNWVSFKNLKNTIAYKTISDISLNPANPNELWISITGVWTNAGEPDPGKFRVLHSTDGGGTWYDYSEGLPAFPVEALEYQTGSNNRLFAGTDVGVFYRDAEMNQWECFSNNLPVSIITDLDYESCSRTLYASTYGRAVFKTSVPFDILNTNVDTLAYQQNILWDKPRRIYSDIFIPGGTTLTITANQFFDQGNRIIVDRGAKLIINDCTIGTACNELWKGIEVWGYSDTSQYYHGVQGRVELHNASIINAELAIMAGKNDENGYYVRGFEGGIIKAFQSNFINNNRSVAFGPYQNFHPITGNEVPNFGRFDQCLFKITKENAEHVNFDMHVFLAGVSGIKFRGCDFDNLRLYPDYPSSSRGIGIRSVFSSFIVTEACLDPNVSPCDSTRPSSFLRLTYGIQAYGSTRNNTCTVDLSEFKYNKTGIYLSAMDLSAINQNYFLGDGTINLDTLNPFQCGLYLDHCTGYQVEENEFKGNYTAAGSTNSAIGITINNSGEQNNRIYNNTCSNLFAGILAQNENRNEDGQYGLEIKCNDFTICEYDIAVTADTAYKDVGIRYSQGSNDNSPTAPANNIFSYTHNNPASDYYNEGGDIVYWYLNDTVSMVNLQPVNYSNPEVNPQKNLHDLGYFSKTENCPSSFTTSGGGGVEENRSKMADAETKIDSTKNLLALLVDGGDTEALSTEVETSFPDEALELRNELIATSPYLSDSVMVNTVEQENVLTEAMVTEILMANPQAAKSDTVQQALDNRFDQLTDDQRTDIDQGWFVTGAKESLESNLAHYHAQRQQALNGIIRIFRNDSLCEASSDSIIAVLENENSLSSKYALAFEYYAKVDYSTASTTLNNIPSSFNLSTTQSSQHQLYVDYLNLLIQLNTQNKSILDCDSTQKAILSTVFNNANGSLQMLARNALINLDAIGYIEPYILPGEGLKEEKIRRVPVRKYYTEDKFKLYPNPAASYIIIEYILSGEIPEGIVYFIDNKGVIVKQLPIGKSHDYLVVPIEDLPSGIYYCKFVVENKASQVEKLIISR